MMKAALVRVALVVALARAQGAEPKTVGATRPGAGAPQDAGSAGDAGAPGPLATPGIWPDSAVPTDVIDTALLDGEFTGFLKAVAEADLAEVLKGPGPFTVLAPNDAAFAKLKPKEWQKLVADRERLRRVVRYHVMPGRLSKADLAKLKPGDRLPTLLEGKKVKLGQKKDRLSFDKATLVKADVEASNGVLHVVDAVLVP